MYVNKSWCLRVCVFLKMITRLLLEKRSLQSIWRRKRKQRKINENRKAIRSQERGADGEGPVTQRKKCE